MQNLTIEEIENCSNIFDLPFNKVLRFLSDSVHKLKQFKETKEKSEATNRLLKAIKKLHPVTTEENLMRVVTQEKIRGQVNELDLTISILKESDYYKSFSLVNVTNVAIQLISMRTDPNTQLIKSINNLTHALSADNDFKNKLLKELENLTGEVGDLSGWTKEVHDLLSLRL